MLRLEVAVHHLFYFPCYLHRYWSMFLYFISTFSSSLYLVFSHNVFFSFLQFCSPSRFFFPFCSAELVWCQEEPKNMGAWTYVKPRFDTILREGDIKRKPIRHVNSDFVLTYLNQFFFFFCCSRIKSEEVQYSFKRTVFTIWLMLCVFGTIWLKIHKILSLVYTY